MSTPSKIVCGTRIKFVKEISEGPDDYAPGRLFAERGEVGVVLRVGLIGSFEYSVKTDSWPNPFFCDRGDFEVIGAI